MDVWNYFEGRPEIFAAVVAAVGIVGAVVGARIQANGGRAQAAAAREAAQIAADAQREAALWSVRQVRTAEFIQKVREVERICELFYSEGDLVGQRVPGKLHDAFQEMIQKHAEIALMAPSPVVHATNFVGSAVEDLAELATSAGPGEFLRGALIDMSVSEDPDSSSKAFRAIDALSELASARLANENRAVLFSRAFIDATEALRDIPGISDAHIGSALTEFPFVVRDEKLRRKQAVAESGGALVEAARAMLRSEDNVTLVRLPRARRWFRNSGDTEAGSA
ncbi:hypothetical protein [Streptomyces roseolus]|uniref:hypothetical protein n=1 Tax=Streptomyces roseolus TaxID=67358 RepID=UPI00167C2A72|nr:hypothetical protein [Streptomyces roseolus]GGR51677.1 hypothetical protein GCM10010282_50760 [Streptomyces roseolus]